ncbi:MAG TPA: hypothetical protein VFJ95_15235 [Gammaproteobacteria bacterium]|nr:hypothetical protein [Gammaproteobacteria bacterium]
MKLRTIVHSPSSIALARRCHRAWWLRYREGLKPPEFTWAQVCAWEAWRKTRRGKRPPEPRGGQRSTALGKEVHRLAEIYLTAPPRRVARKRMIDWTDLPGLCLAELVPHLPEAGSLRRSDVERNVSLKIDGVSWRGVIDVALPPAARAVLESFDHKSSGDILRYALLPHAVAERIAAAWRAAVPAKAQARLKLPARSLRDDLQACMYVLARGEDGLCRWNYTETKRVRRSLPVVAFIPAAHARKIVRAANEDARAVAALRSQDEAAPNTLACDDYGGCWYRAEGHCKVPRKLGAVMALNAAKHEENEAMKKAHGVPKKFADLERETAEANEAEERAARKAAKKRASKPEPEEDEDAEDEAPEYEPEPEPAPKKRKSKPAPEPEEDEAAEPESEPAPKAKSKSVKQKLADAEDAEEDEEAGEDAEDAEEDAESEDPEDDPPPAAPSARARAQREFDAAVPHDAVLAHFDRMPADASPQLTQHAQDFRSLAQHLATVLSATNLDRAVTLRRLLEARDAAFNALHTEGVAVLDAAKRKARAK